MPKRPPHFSMPDNEGKSKGSHFIGFIVFVVIIAVVAVWAGDIRF